MENTLLCLNGVSDNSSPLVFGTEGGGAAPPTPAKFICEFCHQPHDGSYGSGRFCSVKCKTKFANRISFNSEKHKKHISKLHSLRRKTDGWKCNICNEICLTRAQLKQHKKDIHNYEYNHNKGLTKKTSDIVRKMSETLKTKYKSGELVPRFLGKHQSIETREKLSKIQCEHLLLNDFLGKRPDVKWYKVKNILNVEYSNQGTWERDIAIWLNSKNILWEKRKVIDYLTEDGVRKKYIPDFYLPNTNEYIEIKGLFSKYDKIKMNNVIKSNPKIRIYFLHGKKIINMFLNNKTTLSDSYLYTTQC